MLKAPSYAMINVSDMARSIEFYRDKLGLAVRFDSPGWTELETGTTTLALHHVSGGPAPKQAPGTEPWAGTCQLAWSVDDIETTHAELLKRGVVFVMPPTPRPQEGIVLAIALDPDGMTVSFAQSLR